MFDLLHWRGQNLRDQPLEARRALLRSKVFPRLPGDIVLMSETLEAPVAEIITAAKQLGLEGIVAKRRDSCYEPGKRSGAWVKMRINKGQELVIGGYVPAAETLIRWWSAITKAGPYLRRARAQRLCAGLARQGF